MDRGRVKDLHTWNANHDPRGVITAAREGETPGVGGPIRLFPQAYLLQLKIEEASWRLRSGDLGIPPNPEDRFTSENSLLFSFFHF